MRFLLCLFLIVTGCAPGWVVEYIPSEVRPAWYHQSGTIFYEYSIKGFAEKNHTLYSMIRGKKKVSITRPIGFAIGRDGRFAIVDSGCRCVHLYIPQRSSYIKIFRAKERFLSPTGITFDDEMRLFISDSLLGIVYIFDQDGKPVDSITGFTRPTGLSFKEGILYVVDTGTHEVHAIKDKRIFYSFGGRGEGKGKFNFPTYIHVTDRMVYITDSMNFKVEIFSRAGEFFYSFGHHGNGSGDFAMPKGLGVDRDGIIYVVDALFDNIQLFNSNGEFLQTIGARGIGEAEFWLPTCLFIDEDEKIFVCDTYNDRIQVFKLVRQR